MIVASIALGIAAHTGPSKQPAWLDFSIASYIMRYDDQHEVLAVHDKKSGYYLARSVECDGGVVTLTLTRDRSEVEDMGFTMNHERSDGYMPLIEKPLPSLATGRGVSIGDTRAAVRRKLGDPTDTDDQTWTYTWKTKIGGNDGEYDNVYTFKHGKLVEIEFSRDDGVG